MDTNTKNNGINKYINPSLIKGTVSQNVKAIIVWLSVILVLTLFSLISYVILSNFDFSTMTDIPPNMIQMIESMKSFGIVNYYISDSSNETFIAGMIFSAVVAMAALLKDENKNTTEFLFSHPISRKKMYFTQLLSSLSIIIIFNTIFMLINLIMLFGFNGFSFDLQLKQFVQYNYVFLLINVLYGLFMYGLAGILKGKNYVMLAVVISLGMYFLQIILGLLIGIFSTEYSWLDNINHIFISNIANIKTGASLEINIRWQPFVIWLILAAGMNIWGFFRYRKKNLNCA